jgi:HEAT repeat protein
MRSMTARLALLSTMVPALALAAPARRDVGALSDEDSPEVQATVPSGPDQALLRGLLWAFQPAPVEIRVLAIEDLGFLGDPRALDPLAHLCLDANPVVARAALRAIAAIRHPRAEEILAAVLRHPLAHETARQRALELLPFQNTPSALHTIQRLARATPVTALVVSARRLAAELEAPPPSPEGRP